MHADRVPALLGKRRVGLGHYEGRGWLGFHHHGTLCIAAYGFLLCERETSLAKPALPEGCRPRGAPIRPQRHVPNSITTIHRKLAVAIARTLPRCPCCARSFTRTPRHTL